MGAEIRKYQQGEERVLYDICLLTGDSGADASGLYQDPLLLGEMYVGPYLRLAPEHALVGVDASGIAGYVLGVPDTVAFETECEASWWPPLRERYPLSSFSPESQDGRIVRMFHNPLRAEPDVVARYPAHLHIDLLPRLQGRGDGRRLLTALLDGLAAVGASGVHLGVSTANQRAIGFYRGAGFTEVRTYGSTLVMARPL